MLGMPELIASSKVVEDKAIKQSLSNISSVKLFLFYIFTKPLN